MLAREYTARGVPVSLLAARPAYLREAARDGVAGVRLVQAQRNARTFSPSRRGELTRPTSAAAGSRGGRQQMNCVVTGAGAHRLSSSVGAGWGGGAEPSPMGATVGRDGWGVGSEQRLVEALHAAMDATYLANAAYEARLAAEAKLDGSARAEASVRSKEADAIARAERAEKRLLEADARGKELSASLQA
eukprot:7384947-Prymnesium_polylepis.1